MRYGLLGLLMLVSAGLTTAVAKSSGRSFEECQARAVALGILPSRTTKVAQNYERFKAAGTAIRPRGVVARCMAGAN